MKNWKTRTVFMIDSVFKITGWIVLTVLATLLALWAEQVVAYEYIHPDKPFVANKKLGVRNQGNCPQWLIDSVVKGFKQFPGAPDSFHDEKYIEGLPYTYVNGVLTNVDSLPLEVSCVDDIDAEREEEESVVAGIKSAKYLLRSISANTEDTITLASTSISWYTSSKNVASASIKFALDHITKENVGGVAIHEGGHVLGLGHAPHKEAIMYYLYTGKKSVHADDLGGFAVLYGLCNQSYIDNDGNVFLTKGIHNQLGTYQAVLPRKGKPFEVKKSECVSKE